MTPKERAAMQQALEAIGNTVNQALDTIREALAEPQTTTPDVCGEVCARAKLCYGCNKDLEEANAKYVEQAEQEPVAWANGSNLSSAVINRQRSGQGDTHTWSETKTDYHSTPLYAATVQQVTRADLKAAFKEGFERAADLYAPNDGQEPYAYEVWDVQDQSFTMIYATQLKEFHWIEPENIARVLYTAPVRTKDLTDDEIGSIYEKHHALGGCWTDVFAYERAVIAADRELNK